MWKRRSYPNRLRLQTNFTIKSKEQKCPFRFTTNASRIYERSQTNKQFLPTPLIQRNSRRKNYQFINTGQCYLFCPFCQLSSPILLLRISSFRRSQILSKTNVLNINRLYRCLYQRPRKQTSGPRRHSHIYSSDSDRGFSQYGQGQLICST